MSENLNKGLSQPITCNNKQKKSIYKSCVKLKSFKINNIESKMLFFELWARNKVIDRINDLVFYCDSRGFEL